VRGRMLLAMTWPDDPAIPVDWLFDEVYEPGLDTSNTSTDWINLYTTDNPNLDQGAIAETAGRMSDEVRRVRIYGEPIRFSNRVHPLFTDQDQWWCFPCGKTIVPSDGKCRHCSSSTITKFCHVGDHPPSQSWPTIWIVDPHPRKPHMFSWWQIDPKDDLYLICEGECSGDPTDVRMMCDDVESRLGIKVTHRYIDPNMGKSPSSSKRGITWQDEFQAAGLVCDLADDSGVGRKRIDEYLKPDPNTLEPRIKIDRSCQTTIFQMKRYVWDDFKSSLEKAQKQIAKDKNDDFPTMMKYLLNTDPNFNFASMGAPMIRRISRPTSSRSMGAHR